MAFSRSAHSSPVPVWLPSREIVTAVATSTLLVTIAFPLSMRQSDGTVEIVYSRVQPDGVKSSLSRSVYARGSAKGRMTPLRPLSKVRITRHLISAGSNGASSCAKNFSRSASVNFVAAISHLLGLGAYVFRPDY